MESEHTGGELTAHDGPGEGAPPPAPPLGLSAPAGVAEPEFAIDEAHLGRSIYRMAWPVVLEHFSFGLLALVDIFLVGRFVGDDAIAGVGVAGLAMWLAQTGAYGIEIGTTTVAGWDAGARRTHQLRATVQTAVLIAIAWGVIIGVLLVAGASTFTLLMGLEGQARDDGTVYMMAIAPAMFFLAITFAGAGAYRGGGNSRFPMMVLLSVNVLNAGLTYLLISGVVGLEMGVFGSGLGLSIASALGTVIMLGSLWMRKGALGWTPGIPATARVSGRRILHIGVPSAMEEAVFLAAFLGYTRIVATLGNEAVAAHTVALRLLDMAIWPVFGLGTAATALVGQSMGARRIDLAQKVASRTQLYAMLLMVGVGAAMFLSAPQVVALFSDDPAVTDEATKALRVLCFAYPGLALHFTSAGSLRGAGDVLFVMFALLGTAFLVRLPVAWFGVNVLGWGLAGAWSGALVEIWVRASLSWGRFRRGYWKTRTV